MSQKRIQQIERRIDRIKTALSEIKISMRSFQSFQPASTRIPNTTPGPIGRSATRVG